MRPIMDVSRWQGNIDWDKVKASGLVSGVMLKTVSTNRELLKRYEGGSPFVLLGYLNDFWAYVQIENFEGTGQPARGFVSRRSLGV